MDNKDRQILQELDLNARQTDAQIAKKLGVSREVVAYRIKRLEDNNIISGYITSINHNAFGVVCYRVFIKFIALTDSEEREVIEYLSPDVSWIAKVRGNWSMNIMVFCDDFIKFEKFINKFKARFDDKLIDVKISILNKIYHYKKNYLTSDTKRANHDISIMGGEVLNFVVDDVDKKILSCVESNSRLSTVEIGRRCEISERVVRYRLKKLVDNKVIMEFKIFVNFSQFGYNYYKINITYNKFDSEKIKLIINLVSSNPNVLYRAEGINDCDLELELHARNHTEIYAFVDSLINEFPGVIRDYEILEYDKEFLNSYFNFLE